MDKRTAIFITLVLASFLCVNLFFSYKRNQYQQREGQKAATERVQPPQAAPLSSFALVPIYSGPEEAAPLAQGIDVQGNTLLLAWKRPLPETVFVNGQEQRLVTKDAVIGAPVLYGKKGFDSLPLPSLPETGTYEVQLLTFEDPVHPEVHAAHYRNGTLIADPLASNAIAFYRFPKGGYAPVGFYEQKGNIFIELQTLPTLSPYIRSPGNEEAKSRQAFFVLENEYQQLVFSNVGGALAEINLPLREGKHSKSVVNEIGFDRLLKEESPGKSRFPAHPYFIADSQEENTHSRVGGYYPLLRRDMGDDKKRAPLPQYYALNLVSEYPEMASLHYEVTEFTPTSITFEATQPHRRIVKTYSFSDAAPYCFNLSIKIEGDSRGLWLASGIPEVEIMSNSSSPQIQYHLTRNGKGGVEKLKLPKTNEVVTVGSIYPDWIVNSNGYLGIIMDPLGEMGPGYKATSIPGNALPTRLSHVDSAHKLHPPSKYPGYQVLLPIPSQGGHFDMRIYAGPFEENTLKTVDQFYSDPHIGYNPDYSACRTFFGWFSFISKPFAKLLYLVMKFFHTLTGSWAFSIILLTLFLRILLYPLNAWSIKSMRRMQQISPRVQAIQQKYKKDPKKSQMEIMNLYRQEKVNPFMGCIPIVIQIPFLIAMFDLLKSSFQLRGAAFIPGWIDNLTAPDVLFQWTTPIFFIGNQFHLLPILLGVVMFIQQRFSSTAPKDPKEMTDQQRQQKAMGSIMTVVFTVMFYHFPSGLNLYWLSSMLLGIGQQWLTNKLLSRKEKLVSISSKNLALKKIK